MTIISFPKTGTLSSSSLPVCRQKKNFFGEIVKHLLFSTLIVAGFVLSGCGNEGMQVSEENLTDKPNVIIIFADDMGNADVGVQQQRSDIKTPNLDSIARNGARMTNGYVTAPQCTPSRAGLLTGRYQQKIGVDDTSYAPMPLTVKTIGDYFKSQGYKTGMVGKWHLEIGQNSKEWVTQYDPTIDPDTFKLGTVPLDIRKQYFPNHRGFEDVYYGYVNMFWTTFNLNGNSKPESYVTDTTYRIDTASNAAVTFIKRHTAAPFFLYLAYYAPHVPLEAPENYLNRFPNADVERRKYALAMISAVDDGVGRVMEALRFYGLLENTIIVFMSDNGAPLGMGMPNTPVTQTAAAWNGSMNTPFTGEKGMLSEGGIHIPFLIQWPRKIPARTVITDPTISLDISYTVLKAAGADASALQTFDGVDLMPALEGNQSYLQERPLFWRFWNQSAVRLCDWKYLEAGKERRYLFNLKEDPSESINLLGQNPQKAEELKLLLNTWKSTLQRPDQNGSLNTSETLWYDYYF